ncbi:DUF2780 domain-containing protein [Nitrosomonas sp. Is37]|uniref:DUF2780 domain-containing protein n=1 Tax=Nitrosomonas sp. Is37 TaxID=3080535 RepID=UPI00294B8DD1|nr:DUF2780 domain-containing protein [Nitrosomonas sp. Is37]MDV6344955.1 DUF2780 domain-containing protein [Nitrosomonas sp. Is37]
MQIIRLIITCLSLSIALFLFGHANAIDLGDLPGASSEILEKGTQVLPGGESATGVVPVATSATGLIGQLMQQLGVNQRQAEVGTGALFQLAKPRMSAENFTVLTNVVPEMPDLLAAAPPPSPLGGGGMAATFLESGLKPEMVQKFIHVMVQYVEGGGGGSVAAALKSALMGGM